jgi:hypothetical protein
LMVSATRTADGGRTMLEWLAMTGFHCETGAGCLGRLQPGQRADFIAVESIVSNPRTMVQTP